MGKTKGVEMDRELGHNYESAPWLSWEVVFEHERLKGKQGQMLEKRLILSGYYQNALLTDWLTHSLGIWWQKISVTVEKLQKFYMKYGSLWICIYMPLKL